MEHEGQVIEWETFDEPRIPVPKPDIIIVPDHVEGGREDFWRQVGWLNWRYATFRHNSDKAGHLLPIRKHTTLPDGSTWVDHMWTLTPGTRINYATDDYTVLMTAETPVSVTIWTVERPDAPITYGGPLPPQWVKHSGASIAISPDMPIIQKTLARRHGIPYQGDIRFPWSPCRKWCPS